MNRNLEVFYTNYTYISSNPNRIPSILPVNFLSKLLFTCAYPANEIQFKWSSLLAMNAKSNSNFLLYDFNVQLSWLAEGSKFYSLPYDEFSRFTCVQCLWFILCDETLVHIYRQPFDKNSHFLWMIVNIEETIHDRVISCLLTQIIPTWPSIHFSNSISILEKKPITF